ncbi:MAG: DUF1653 domain-containing protein [Clostridium sp.]
MDRTPKTGELYHHFKDKLYQIVTVAADSETGEPMVVYQALYGDYRTYVRSLSMFVSEVDHEKYPKVNQRYRFEKVILEAHTEPVERVCEPKKLLNPHLLTFVEAENYEDKLEMLYRMKGNMGQEELELLYVALDMAKPEGTVEEQICAVEQFLRMQKRYDGGHLRRV